MLEQETLIDPGCRLRSWVVEGSRFAAASGAAVEKVRFRPACPTEAPCRLERLLEDRASSVRWPVTAAAAGPRTAPVHRRRRPETPDVLGWRTAPGSCDRRWRATADVVARQCAVPASFYPRPGTSDGATWSASRRQACRACLAGANPAVAADLVLDPAAVPSAEASRAETKGRYAVPHPAGIGRDGHTEPRKGQQVRRKRRAQVGRISGPW